MSLHIAQIKNNITSRELRKSNAKTGILCKNNKKFKNVSIFALKTISKCDHDDLKNEDEPKLLITKDQLSDFRRPYSTLMMEQIVKQ